jgi:hypothetical protein
MILRGTMMLASKHVDGVTANNGPLAIASATIFGQDIRFHQVPGEVERLCRHGVTVDTDVGDHRMERDPLTDRVSMVLLIQGQTGALIHRSGGVCLFDTSIDNTRQ